MKHRLPVADVQFQALVDDRRRAHVFDAEWSPEPIVGDELEFVEQGPDGFSGRSLRAAVTYAEKRFAFGSGVLVVSIERRGRVRQEVPN